MAASSTVLAPQAIALNRFGLGARPTDDIRGDPKAWLSGQFDRFDVRARHSPLCPTQGRRFVDIARSSALFG